MRRLMWGAVLFLITAGGVSADVSPCQWERLALDPDSAAAIVTQGGNTMVIDSDEDVVTIVVYDDEDGRKSSWM